MRNLMNIKFPMLFLLSLSISVAIAADQQRGPGSRGPQLTDEQKTCLEGKLGARDSGNRPTHEAMVAAMSACGVERPKGPPGGRRGGEQAQEQAQNSEQTADE